jgi:hypothetical protein
MSAPTTPVTVAMHIVKAAEAVTNSGVAGKDGRPGPICQDTHRPNVASAMPACMRAETSSDVNVVGHGFLPGEEE